MNIGDVVEHIDKESKSGYPHDKRYIYTDNVRAKNPDTGEWFDAVLYQEPGINGRLFVRDKDDFMDKFKAVEKDDSQDQEV